MLKSNETYVIEEDGSIHKMLFSGDANWEERATTSIQEIRANVIDEFAEKVKEIYPFTLLELEELDGIAEQMKAGGV